MAFWKWVRKGDEGDGAAGSLEVGAAAGAFGDLGEVALSAEAGGVAAEAGVAVVDGVDGNAGALGVLTAVADVGAVLIGHAGAAVVGIDAVGDHDDEAGLVGGLL